MPKNSSKQHRTSDNAGADTKAGKIRDSCHQSKSLNASEKYSSKGAPGHSGTALGKGSSRQLSQASASKVSKRLSATGPKSAGVRNHSEPEQGEARKAKRSKTETSSQSHAESCDAAEAGNRVMPNRSEGTKTLMGSQESRKSQGASLRGHDTCAASSSKTSRAELVSPTTDNEVFQNTSPQDDPLNAPVTFFNWKKMERAAFKTKDRMFKSRQSRPSFGSLVFILVHHCDFFPEDISSVLKQCRQLIKGSDRVIVFGPPAPQPAQPSLPRSPRRLADMPAPSPRRKTKPQPPQIVFDGRGSQLPSKFCDNIHFLVKTLDFIFLKAMDPERRKPLSGVEKDIWELLERLLEQLTNKCDEWTRDAIDVNHLADADEVVKAVTGAQPWTVLLEDPSTGMYKFTWRPLESVIIRQYLATPKHWKSGSRVTPLASMPSRIAFHLGDRPATSQLLQLLATYGDKVKHELLRKLLQSDLEAVVHGVLMDGSPAPSPALMAASNTTTFQSTQDRQKVSVGIRHDDQQPMKQLQPLPPSSLSVGKTSLSGLKALPPAQGNGRQQQVPRVKVRTHSSTPGIKPGQNLPESQHNVKDVSSEIQGQNLNSRKIGRRTKRGPSNDANSSASSTRAEPAKRSKGSNSEPRLDSAEKGHTRSSQRTKTSTRRQSQPARSHKK